MDISAITGFCFKRCIAAGLACEQPDKLFSASSIFITAAACATTAVCGHFGTPFVQVHSGIFCCFGHFGGGEMSAALGNLAFFWGGWQSDRSRRPRGF